MISLNALGDDFTLNTSSNFSLGLSVNVEYILIDGSSNILVDGDGNELMIPEASGSSLGISALGDDFTLNAE